MEIFIDYDDKYLLADCSKEAGLNEIRDHMIKGVLTKGEYENYLKIIVEKCLKNRLGHILERLEFSGLIYDYKI